MFLYHAAQKAVFGLDLIRKLASHGYEISPGTLYSILHKLERQGYLQSEKKVVAGKVRKNYTATPTGANALSVAKVKARELLHELNLDTGN
ncbi:MAG: PadR family transcriptional regulator [Anaerolineae bacterium]